MKGDQSFALEFVGYAVEAVVEARMVEVSVEKLGLVSQRSVNCCVGRWEPDLCEMRRERPPSSAFLHACYMSFVVMGVATVIVRAF